MNGKTHAIVASATMTSIALLNWNSGSILGVEVIPLLTLPTAIIGGLKADFEVGSERGKMEHPILARILEHRGLTHTGIILLVIYALNYSLTMGDTTTVPIKIVSSLMLGFFVGYATHLLATDIFNGKGAPLFWPIFPKRFHIMSITTAYNRKDGKKVGAMQESLFLVSYLSLLLVHTISVLGGWVL